MRLWKRSDRGRYTKSIFAEISAGDEVIHSTRSLHRTTSNNVVARARLPITLNFSRWPQREKITD
jgi:hypothetical protein